MSSSSAYSNVLLKSPVAPQAAAAPKRDYQDDYSRADFSQSFNEARDSVRSDDKKIAKPAVNKKPAPTEDRKETTEASTQKKPLENADADDRKITDTDKNCTSDDAIAKDKNTDDKDNKKTDDSNNYVATTTLVQPDTIATGIALPTALPAAITTDQPESDVVTTDTPTDAIATTLAATSTAIENNKTSNAISSATNGTSEVPDAKAGAAVTEEVLSSDLVTSTETDIQNLEASQSLAKDLQQTVGSQIIADTATEQAAQENVASVLGANSAVKTSPTNSVTVDTTLEDSADEISALAANLSSEKTANKVNAKNETGTESLTKSDTQTALAQPLDSKSVFEKMLQTVARSGSGVSEETTALNPVQNSTTNSTSSTAMDSLVRLNDTQTPAARSFVVQTAVAVPVGQPQWSEAVGEKVLWLAAQNVSSAEINLHPKDLGPIQVKVSVNQEQATVSFTSHHAVVREVLDQNLNRLRDMFNEQGLNLVNVDVSDKSFSRQQGDAKDQKNQTGANGGVSEEESVVAVSTIVQQRLVDHYA